MLSCINFKGDRRAFSAVSLAEDTGTEDTVVNLARLMLHDPNLTITGTSRAASDAALEWSAQNSSKLMAEIGLDSRKAGAKLFRVLVISLNSSVTSKFFENLDPTEFVVEQSSLSESETALQEQDSKGASAGDGVLPIRAILAPPTVSDSQRAALMELAGRHNVGFAVTVPRNAIDALRAL